MAPFTTLLELFGLTTKRRLNRAVAKRNLWHGLVRDVFAQFYLKFRETFPDHLPQLPHRYSQDWETLLRRELDEFLQLDLTEVADLLDTCGFGTEKWDALRQAGFPRLGELIDHFLEGQTGNGRATALEVAAFGADLDQIASENPALVEELSQRFDPEVGRLVPTDEEIRTSPLYRELETELRKLRAAGHRALDQIEDYETRLEELQSQLGANGQLDLMPPVEVEPENALDGASSTVDESAAEVAELNRQNAELGKELKAKNHRIESLEEETERLGKDLEAKERTIAALRAEGSDEINDLTRENEDLRRTWPPRSTPSRPCANNCIPSSLSWAGPATNCSTKCIGSKG